MRPTLVRPLALAVVLAVVLAGAPAALAAQQAQLLVGSRTLAARAVEDSCDAVVVYEAGIGSLSDGRHDEAERYFRRALEINPRLAPAHLGLSALPYARRRKLWEEEARGKLSDSLRAVVNEANRSYRRAFLIDPFVDLAVFGLVREERGTLTLYGASGKTVHLLNGLEQYYAGLHGGAYDLFTRAIGQDRKRDPRLKVPLYVVWLRSLAAAHMGMNDSAASDMRFVLGRVQEREKTDSMLYFTTLPSNEIRYVLATIRQRGGHAEEARELYREVLTNDLAMYMAHVRLAEIEEAAGRWDAAIAERRSAAEKAPEDPTLLHDLGVALAKRRQWRDAVGPLTEAATRGPLNPRVFHSLAEVHRLLGNRAEERAALERFVAIAPSAFRAQIEAARRRLATLS